jgi:hypothetical protein
MRHAPVRPRASFASLLMMVDGGELRSAPHAVRQGAPAREAMPQKSTTRQAHGPKIVLNFCGIALNKRWKIFFTARAKNRPRGPAASPHSPKFPEKIRKKRFQR